MVKRTSTVIPSWTANVFAVMEGKQQAIAILKDKKLVDELAEYDPTATKKYVTVFARLVKAGVPKEKFETLAPKIADAERKNISIDLSKIKTFEELDAAVSAHAAKITKGSAKRGISGLNEGEDYVDFGQVESKNGVTYHGYVPLNYEASCVIASSRVGGAEGKWCISYQKDKSHWNRYVKTDKNFFVVLTPTSGKPNGDDAKLCLQCTRNGTPVKVWDAADKSYAVEKYFD